jgi:hypothetical protein
MGISQFWQQAQTPFLVRHGRIGDIDQTTDIRPRTPKWQGGKKWTGHGISIKNASGGEMEITGVYTIHFLIDGRNMQAPFIVTKEATSIIIGMNVIRTYKLKMDVLTTRVTAALVKVASLQTSEECDVKVHTDIKVEAGMSHLTKLFLQDKKSEKRLFGRHQFMVTVGLLAVATVSDKDNVFELLIPNSTRYDV